MSDRFEIRPLFAPALAAVAQFLDRWRRRENRDTGTPADLETRLRWLLVDNPAVRGDGPLGFCVQDRDGLIHGLNLCYPAEFLAGARRLRALGSGGFYVESPARSLGFYLFKKYLGLPDSSFFFSTTCNAASAELWRKLGGAAVPQSDVEYILPLRVDRIASQYVSTKTSSGFARRLAQRAGRSMNPILRPGRRPASGLAVEPCRDCEKLAALALRHQPADQIAPHRSVSYLQWRYGRFSPLSPCQIYKFQDRHGNEGWFSLGNLIRGRQTPLHASVLLDAIWPREKMSFRAVFAEIVAHASSQADALVLRSQPALNYRESSRRVIRYRLPAPRTFVRMAKNTAPLELHLFDYEDGDYGAWRRHWPAESDSTAPAIKDEQRAYDLCV